MALDGIFLHAVRSEIMGWIGSRIDRINQPSREELIFTLRKRDGSKKLLLSANAESARVHFTNHAPENPKSPPMLCMLLRKRLGRARLNAVSQLETDRVLFLEFEASTDLGEHIVYIVAVEIMNRHSNIIIYQKDDGIILDAVKRIDPSKSKVRPILPGLSYSPPPMQNKMSLLSNDAADIVSAVCEQGNLLPEKALMQKVQGISPIVARELCASLPAEPVSSLDLSGKTILFHNLHTLSQRLKEGNYSFSILMDQHQPKDFSLIPITQYGELLTDKRYVSAGELLDEFYRERSRVIRMKQSSQNLIKLLQNAIQRTQKTLAIRQEEQRTMHHREDFRQYGDLLSANLYLLKKGQQQIELENFYLPNHPTVTIPLNPAKTPSQNVQHYYTEYKKASRAEKILQDLIEKAQNELEYLESELDLVSRVLLQEDVAAIRQELTEQGWIKPQKKNVKKANRPLPPLRYTSDDGFSILCGRNNKQNDELTFKHAAKSDLWLHVKDIPGSHVVVCAKGREIPPQTLLQAACVAAYNSKARYGSQVPVDYTFIRYVKKPSGAKPGKVIFTNNKTLYVQPDEQLTLRLAQTQG